MNRLKLKEIKVVVHEHTFAIDFGIPETYPFYFSNEEVREWEPGEWRRMAFDLSSTALIQPWSVVLYKAQRTDCFDSELECRAYEIHIDMKRLFAALREFRAKGLKKATINIDRLRVKCEDRQTFTFTEMVNHTNNARPVGFAAVVKNFVDHLKPEYVPVLKQRLSRQLTTSKVFAVNDREKSEIYFDGRIPGGCGFNGAFILRGDEFSIHT